jgi:hypothetical protein
MVGFENHPLAPYSGKRRSPLSKGGGIFAGVFFKYLTMPKTKKDKMKTKAEGSGKSLLVEPSSECKEFVVALIARFYERESTMSLESCYVRYVEEGITKFKLDALHNDKWMEETQKSGYQKFLDNVVHDSIWNVKNILTKYGKAHQPGNAAFMDVIATTDLFATRLKLFTKSRNQAKSIAWWTSPTGMVEAASQRRHLVALPPTAKVIPIDNIRRQGGYATIRRVCLEGVPEFNPWWEFAAKQSNQIDKQNDLAKMEHQNESMAVTIPHAGVIRFAAIHAERYKGYAFWWNGGTLRDMFNLDNRYGDNIATRVAYENTSGDELLCAKHLRRFRKKQMELAWALLHIMDEVHKSHNLHNDISPNNILLHFPEESKV